MGDYRIRETDQSQRKKLAITAQISEYERLIFDPLPIRVLGALISPEGPLISFTDHLVEKQ
jgi:hypothetical protein